MQTARLTAETSDARAASPQKPPPAGDSLIPPRRVEFGAEPFAILVLSMMVLQTAASLRTWGVKNRPARSLS